MGKGRGCGYRNLIGKDPSVHSQSARGMRQPQKLPYVAQVQMSQRGIGKAHTDTVPNIKLKQIGGDVNWEQYGGQFMVEKKFNNGEFDYYLIIDFINFEEATGDAMPKKYNVSISAVAPSQVSKEDMMSAFKSFGYDDPKEQIEMMKKSDEKAVAGILSEYGIKATLFNESGNNAKELIATAKKQIPAIEGMFGFYMDKPENFIGNTGWDFIKGDLGIKGAK
jgi:hypothetical protein